MTVIKVTESTDAKNARLNELCRKIRREGKILDRWEKFDKTGAKAGFFIEWRGSEYLVRMHNGQATRIKELWPIE